MSRARFLRHGIGVRKANKYSAKLTVVDGITFHSQKEARYYSALKLRKQAGEILMFLRQVPFQLPGNTKYFVDFQEFHSDGSVHFIDVKGQMTEVFKLKKRQVEELYPVEIEIV